MEKIDTSIQKRKKQATGKRANMKKTTIQHTERFAFFLVLPAHFLLFFIVVFPLISSIYLSLTIWAPMTSGGIKWYEAYKFWGGLTNYWNIIRDVDFLKSLLRTFIIVGVVLPIEFFAGLGLAFLFLDNFPGKKIYHSILLTPMMIVPAVVGFIFYMLFQSSGPINALLSGVLYRNVNIAWLQGRVSALLSIMIADIWEWTPLMFLILLSGLMALPQDQINAAIILGASRWQRFKRIIFPLMKPVMIIALIIRGLEAIRIFDVVWLMTSGGPGTSTETISAYMYRQGFKYLNWSWVTACGLIVLILVVIISLYALRPIRRAEEKEA